MPIRTLHCTLPSCSMILRGFGMILQMEKCLTSSRRKGTSEERESSVKTFKCDQGYEVKDPLISQLTQRARDEHKTNQRFNIQDSKCFPAQ